MTRYFSDDDRDAVMLEDDSGRLRLTGDSLKSHMLVTGCIIAVMGTENASGDFEVVDLQFADLPPQPDRWAVTKPANTNTSAKGKSGAKGHQIRARTEATKL